MESLFYFLFVGVVWLVDQPAQSHCPPLPGSSVFAWSAGAVLVLSPCCYLSGWPPRGAPLPPRPRGNGNPPRARPLGPPLPIILMTSCIIGLYYFEPRPRPGMFLRLGYIVICRPLKRVPFNYSALLATSAVSNST